MEAQQTSNERAGCATAQAGVPLMIEEQKPVLAVSALLESLSGRVCRQVRSLCRRLGLRGEDVKDACQEGLRAAWRAIAAYEPAAQGQHGLCRLTSFVHRAVADAVIDYFRHRQSQEKIYDRALTAGEVIEEGHSSDPGRAGGRPVRGADTDGPLEALLMQERWAHLRQAMEEFSPRDRATCQGMLQGQTKEQMAKEMHCSRATMGRRQQRVRALLKERLGHLCGED